jgi:phosphatidylglycerol:prolipoprotein diacylglycerol transferase
MFPDFHYLFRFLFNIDLPGLSLVKTFGFFVAMAFLAGAWVLAKELRRKKDQGLFQPEIITEETGKPATTAELVWMAVLGFIVGFKVLGLIGEASVVSRDPIGYILSVQGNILGGLALAAVFTYSRYSAKKKAQLPVPKKQKLAVYPHQRVADIIFIAALGGFGGAKIFNAFESWDDFMADPVGNLLSPSGLTFYGGLIVATVALYIYARAKKFSFAHLCDAAAPALMLAYGIGRLGCQFSGDGDWGIYNSAYVTQADGSLSPATPEQYDSTVRMYPQVFLDRNDKQITPSRYTPAPGWMPDWLYAQNFKHNVNNDGIPIAGDKGEYNHVLPAGVFPTSMYEAVVCILLFTVLWSIRKRFKRPLQLFGVYLILNGLERFIVELFRVNYKYDWGFIQPTQAEIIAGSLIIAGILLFLFYKPKHLPQDGRVDQEVL